MSLVGEMVRAVQRDMRAARAHVPLAQREPRDPALLPAPLREYPPARYWAPETVAIWDQATTAPLGVVLWISCELFAQLVGDLVSTQGATPWNDPREGYVTFAGRRIGPDPRDLNYLLAEPHRYTDDGNPHPAPALA